MAKRRPVVGGYDGIAQVRLASGGLSFGSDPVFSVFGERLPSPETSQRLYGMFMQLGEIGQIPRHLVEPVSVSPVTGCWLPVGRYRGPGGYIVSGTTSLNLNSCGSSGGHRALVAVDGPLTELFPEPLTHETHVDHICRVTSCRCPQHLRAMSGLENNRLKNSARNVERGLRAGQLLSLTLNPHWADIFAQRRDHAVVSSRYGAFVLQRTEMEDLVEPTLAPCPVVSELMPPARSSRRKKSLKVGEDQGMLF